MKRIFTLLFLLIVFQSFGQGLETFTNIPTNSSNSYQTRNWVGDNSISWTATDARTDQTINGKAITIRNGILESQANISGGIGSLTVTTQRKFTGGSGNMDVRVNGSSVGTVPYAETVQTTTISNINISGNFTLVIDATNSSTDRPAIDDVTWTSYSGASTPTIIVSPSTLTGFTYEEGSGPSAEQSFTVEGSNLEGDIIVTPPANWEISATSGGPFQTSDITLTESGGSVAQTTIYTRMIAGLSAGSYAGDIACASTNADTKNVAVSGSVTEQETVSPGDIIITEIMQNPVAVADNAGEWFEVYNTTSSDIDLNGWEISDNGSDSHVISGSVIVPALGFAVLGNNSNSATNGGVTVNYQYSGITLANGDDEIILKTALGTEIDRVEYDGGPVWPDPDGESMSLDPGKFNSTDNNDGANWCEEVTVYGDGDKGTPGSANNSCATLPILIKYFDSRLINILVELSWSTATESNSSHFGIERSADSRNFESIGRVLAAGNSREPVRYSYTDSSPLRGRNFYRLRMVDQDGSYRYSDIRAVFVPTRDRGFSLSPTVVSNRMRVEFDQPVDNGRLHIYDLQGNLLSSHTLATGIDILSIDISDMLSGQYLAVYADGDEIATRKFFKR